MLLTLKSYYKFLLGKLTDYTNSKYAIPILIITAFTESSFFIVPPDFLLIAMAFAVPSKALIYALITTVSSVFGGMFGYLIGILAYDGFLREAIINWGYQESFLKFQEFYNLYDVFALFIAGFTPLPYKIATIASGVFHSNFILFVIISLLSRGLRFFLLALIIKFYHSKGKDFIASHFKKVVILSSILVVLLCIILIIFYVR